MGRSPASRLRRPGELPGSPLPAYPLSPFPPGAEVEVRVDDEGFHGSWFEATVVTFHPGRGRRHPSRYVATYRSILSDSGDPLAESFPPSRIRPRAPPPPPGTFSPHDMVEAFHLEGWWSGIVIATAEDSSAASVTVAFPITREVIAFPPPLVRPRRDFAEGRWVPSLAVVAVKPRRAVRVYMAGDKVEVFRDRAVYGYSWFPAIVTKAIDELSCIVEYLDLKDGDGKKLTEYLHWRYIRPAVEQSPRADEFLLGRDAEVEAYCNGAWSPAVVQKVVGKGEYEVSVSGKEAELVLTKNANVLKPRYHWNGNRWRIVTSKRQAYLKLQFSSGKRSSSPVDVATSDDEWKRDPESHAKKRSRKELQEPQGRYLTEDLENSLEFEMDPPLCALQELPTMNHSPKSRSPLSGKNCMEALSESNLRSSATSVKGLLDPLSRQQTPQKECITKGIRELSVVSQESQSDMMLSDSWLNTPDVGTSAGEAHDMLSIVQPKKQFLDLCCTSNTAQQKQERLLPIQSLIQKDIFKQKEGTPHPIQALKGKKKRSDTLKKGKDNSSTKKIVCALGAPRECNTSLALAKRTVASDAAQTIGDKVANSGSNIKIPVSGASKKSAKQKNIKELRSPVSSSDHEVASGKVSLCSTTWALQKKGRKKARLQPEEPSVKMQLMEGKKSSTLQQKDRTLMNNLNINEMANQEVFPYVPPVMEPLCNVKDVGRVNSTPGENLQNSHECSTDGVSGINRQACLLEDESTAMISGISQVNQNIDAFKDNAVTEISPLMEKSTDMHTGTNGAMIRGISQACRQVSVLRDDMTAQIAELNPLMDNSTRMSTKTTDVLSLDSPVQQDGEKAEERPILLPFRNAESTEGTVGNVLLRKCSVAETSMVSHSPICQLSGEQFMFVKSSPMWTLIEAMDVFHKVPQRPHFLPLLQYLPALREGMALGLMISYASLVESIWKLHIEDSIALFEEKMTTLTLLEENGFNVQGFQCRLKKLLQIKSDQTKYMGDRDKLGAQILEGKNDVSQINALVHAKHRAICDLEQKLGTLRVEKETLENHKEHKDAELTRLEKEESEVQRACGNAEQQFYSILVEPW